MAFTLTASSDAPLIGVIKNTIDGIASINVGNISIDTPSVDTLEKDNFPIVGNLELENIDPRLLATNVQIVNRPRVKSYSLKGENSVNALIQKIQLLDNAKVDLQLLRQVSRVLVHQAKAQAVKVRENFLQDKLKVSEVVALAFRLISKHSAESTSKISSEELLFKRIKYPVSPIKFETILSKKLTRTPFVLDTKVVSEPSTKPMLIKSANTRISSETPTLDFEKGLNNIINFNHFLFFTRRMQLDDSIVNFVHKIQLIRKPPEEKSFVDFLHTTLLGPVAITKLKGSSELFKTVRKGRTGDIASNFKIGEVDVRRRFVGGKFSTTSVNTLFVKGLPFTNKVEALKEIAKELATIKESGLTTEAKNDIFKRVHKISYRVINAGQAEQINYQTKYPSAYGITANRHAIYYGVYNTNLQTEQVNNSWYADGVLTNNEVAALRKRDDLPFDATLPYLGAYISGYRTLRNPNYINTGGPALYTWPDGQTSSVYERDLVDWRKDETNDYVMTYNTGYRSNAIYANDASVPDTMTFYYGTVGNVTSNTQPARFTTRVRYADPPFDPLTREISRVPAVPATLDREWTKAVVNSFLVPGIFIPSVINIDKEVRKNFHSAGNESIFKIGEHDIRKKFTSVRSSTSKINTTLTRGVPFVSALKTDKDIRKRFVGVKTSLIFMKSADLDNFTKRFVGNKLSIAKTISVTTRGLPLFDKFQAISEETQKRFVSDRLSTLKLLSGKGENIEKTFRSQRESSASLATVLTPGRFNKSKVMSGNELFKRVISTAPDGTSVAYMKSINPIITFLEVSSSSFEVIQEFARGFIHREKINTGSVPFKTFRRPASESGMAVRQDEVFFRQDIDFKELQAAIRTLQAVIAQAPAQANKIDVTPIPFKKYIMDKSQGFQVMTDPGTPATNVVGHYVDKPTVVIDDYPFRSTHHEGRHFTTNTNYGNGSYGYATFKDYWTALNSTSGHVSRIYNTLSSTKRNFNQTYNPSAAIVDYSGGYTGGSTDQTVPGLTLEQQKQAILTFLQGHAMIFAPAQEIYVNGSVWYNTDSTSSGTTGAIYPIVSTDTSGSGYTKYQLTYVLRFTDLLLNAMERRYSANYYIYYSQTATNYLWYLYQSPFFISKVDIGDNEVIHKVAKFNQANHWGSTGLGINVVPFFRRYRNTYSTQNSQWSYGSYNYWNTTQNTASPLSTLRGVGRSTGSGNAMAYSYSELGIGTYSTKVKTDGLKSLVRVRGFQNQNVFNQNPPVFGVNSDYFQDSPPVIYLKNGVIQQANSSSAYIDFFSNHNTYSPWSEAGSGDLNDVGTWTNASESIGWTSSSTESNSQSDVQYASSGSSQPIAYYKSYLSFVQVSDSSHADYGKLVKWEPTFANGMRSYVAPYTIPGTPPTFADASGGHSRLNVASVFELVPNKRIHNLVKMAVKNVVAYNPAEASKIGINSLDAFRTSFLQVLTSSAKTVDEQNKMPKKGVESGTAVNVLFVKGVAFEITSKIISETLEKIYRKNSLSTVSVPDERYNTTFRAKKENITQLLSATAPGRNIAQQILLNQEIAKVYRKQDGPVSNIANLTDNEIKTFRANKNSTLGIITEIIRGNNYASNSKVESDDIKRTVKDLFTGVYLTHELDSVTRSLKRNLETPVAVLDDGVAYNQNYCFGHFKESYVGEERLFT